MIEQGGQIYLEWKALKGWFKHAKEHWYQNDKFSSDDICNLIDELVNGYAEAMEWGEVA